MDVREYSDECYAVFSSVFGSTVDKDKFYYKHFFNPNRLENPIRTCVKDGKVVGINAFMKMFIVDNSFNRSELHTASQSNDTAVLSEYRGQHIFTNIINEELEAEQTEYIIGIPNDNSYPGFMKMGWVDACEFTNYSIFLKPFNVFFGNNPLSRILGRIYKALFLRRIFSSKTPDFDIEQTATMSLSEKEWKIINDCFDVGIQRSQKYADWKLSNNGDSPKCIVFRKKSELVGYIIFRESYRRKGKSALIDDFAVREGYNIWPQFFQMLYSEVDIIENPLVNCTSKDKKIMEEAGMKDYKKLLRNTKLTRLIVSPKGKESDYLKRIQMRMMDFDIYLNK